MKAIVAADINWGIGREGKLLSHIPEDLKYFRTMTLKKTVIMGRKTYESLPGGRALENRRNVVLTQDPDFSAAHTVVCHSLSQAISQAGIYGSQEVFVIGGGQIYEQLLPWCDRVYVTRLLKDLRPDVYFPDLDHDPDWALASLGEEKLWEDIPFRFCTYERKIQEKSNETAVQEREEHYADM